MKSDRAEAEAQTQAHAKETNSTSPKFILYTPDGVL
jgi:hypothetical protein